MFEANETYGIYPSLVRKLHNAVTKLSEPYYQQPTEEEQLSRLHQLPKLPTLNVMNEYDEETGRGGGERGGGVGVGGQKGEGGEGGNVRNVENFGNFGNFDDGEYDDGDDGSDVGPIDWREFIESANGDSISGGILEYNAVSATTTTTTIASYTDLNLNLNFNLNDLTMLTTTPQHDFTFTVSNGTLPTNFQYPFNNSLNLNWVATCDNEYNPYSANNRLEFWVCGVVLNVVGFLGIIGNVISMIILSRPQMRSSINYLLIGLARCDTMLILTSILLFGIPSIYPHTGYFFIYYNYIYPFISPGVFPVAMIAQTASIYVTFTVTLERYVAVCHPLRARALCTYGRARIYFVVCIVFAVLYNLPRFWEVVTVSYQPIDSDITLHCVRPSNMRQSPTYVNIYINWCYLIVNYIIPLLTLAILNCLIYRQVKRANRERQRLSRSEKREIGLATMLLCVVVVFFFFNFPALVLNISEAFYNIIDHSLTKISNLLVTINSSANFLIYVIFGEKFKRIFLLIFFKRRLSRDQPDLIHYESSISNNGDGTINHRSSGRFSRHGTQRSTTTTYLVTGGSGSNTLKSIRLTQTAGSSGSGGGGCSGSGSGSPGVIKIKRNRAPSPGPIVYYPARDMQRASTAPTVTLGSNNNTALGLEWVDKNTKSGQKTSGF